MKLTRLYPEHFGKFQNTELSFEDGINVIYGENEAGKTTLFAFLRGMLFGIEKPRGRAGKEDRYGRYQPWDTPGAYGGTLEFAHEGVTYRLERSFYQKEAWVRLSNVNTGRELPIPEGTIAAVFPELTESGYCNTVQAPQTGAATDAELAALLQNHIANLETAKSRELDVPAALEWLKGKAKRLEAKKLPAKIAAYTEEIRTESANERELEALAAKLSEESERLARYREREEALTQRKNTRAEEEFQAMRVRLSHYYEDVRQNEETQAELWRIREEKERAEAVRTQRAEAEAWLKEADRRKKLREGEEEKQKQALQALQTERETAEKTAREEIERYQAKAAKLRRIGIPLVVLLIGIFLLLAAKRAEKRANAVLAAWAETEAAFSARQAALQTAQEARMREPELQVSEEEIAAWEKRRDDLLQELGRLSGLDAEEEKLTERTDVKAEELAHRRGELLAYFRQFGELEELEEEEVVELEGRLLARQVQEEEELQEARTARETAEQETVRLQTRLEQGGECEERLFGLRKELEEMEAEAEADAAEVEAIRLAKETVEILTGQIHDEFGKRFHEVLSSYVQRVTAGKYEKTVTDETLRLQTEWNGKWIAAERLSRGTVEQLFLALRLAVGDTMYESYDLPLVFDDSFAAYDDARLSATLGLLASMGRQCLIFTCHKREEALLQAAGIPYHKVTLT